MTRARDTHAPRGAAVLALLLALAAASLALGACAAQPAHERDPLAASESDEVVLRTLRLAGVESASVGRSGRTTFVRVQVPDVSSAADVEVAWQTAAGALSSAYPLAKEYVVQLAGFGGEPLVEITLPGGAARDAISAGDAKKLRAAANVVYLPRSDRSDAARQLPPGSVSMTDGGGAAGSAIGVLRGPYLDAKNRAAGLLGDEGPLGDAAAAATTATATARKAVPGRPAPADGEDPVAALLTRVQAALATPPGKQADGATELADRAAALAKTGGTENVLRLRGYLSLVEAMTAEKPFGDAAAPARRVAQAVEKSLVPHDGPLAAAVLAAAGRPDAPPAARVVTRFEREAGLDTSASAESSPSLPGEVFARLAAAGQREERVLVWDTPDGPESVAPASWLAYRRSDGAVFWLAGDDGPAALTDASVRGWAWSVPMAALVAADDVGRTLSTFEVR